MDRLDVKLIELAGGTVFLSDGQILIITEWLDEWKSPTEDLQKIRYLSANNEEIEILINLSCQGSVVH